MRRSLAWAFVGVLASLGLAHAGKYIDGAAESYREGHVVYIARAADSDGIGREALTARIQNGNVPVFIAILPEEATNEGDVNDLPKLIGGRLPTPVAVGVIVGNKFRANAINKVDTWEASQVASLATAAGQAHRTEGKQAVLLDWVTRLNHGNVGAGVSIDGERLTEETVTRLQPGDSTRTQFTPPPATPARGIHWVRWLLFLSVLGGLGYLLWRLVQAMTEDPPLPPLSGERVPRPSPPPVSSGPEAATLKPAGAQVDLAGKTYTRSSERTVVNNNYFGGGFYQGSYVPPGYYADRFWDYLILDTMLNNRASAPQPVYVTPTPPPTYVQPETLPSMRRADPDPAPSGGTDFSTSRDDPTPSRSDSGGTDFSSSSSDSSDSGGTDFGGGSDSGGSDSGSGGTDF